jgi:hypothetical protein
MNLSNNIRYFGPNLWAIPTAFNLQPAHVKTGLNYFPKATFAAGFFSHNWQNCFLS